jgi:hypothetical protein
VVGAACSAAFFSTICANFFLIHALRFRDGIDVIGAYRTGNCTGDAFHALFFRRDFIGVTGTNSSATILAPIAIPVITKIVIHPCCWRDKWRY